MKPIKTYQLHFNCFLDENINLSYLHIMTNEYKIQVHLVIYIQTKMTVNVELSWDIICTCSKTFNSPFIDEYSIRERISRPQSSCRQYLVYLKVSLASTVYCICNILRYLLIKYTVIRFILYRDVKPRTILYILGTI